MKEIRKNTVLFAGTTGGRLLAECFRELSQPFVIRVVTGYVRDLLENICRPDQAGYMEICQGRLDVAGMEQMFGELWPGLVIDATHLYAAEVTQDVRVVCSGRKRLRLMRCPREPGIGNSRPGAGVVHMPDVEAAITWLPSVTGNILVATGSKELSPYIRIRDYKQRIYIRVLPLEETVARCRSLGFESRHTITMQGSLSEEMNPAQLREYGCTYPVTKDGGVAGEFSEKIKATCRANTVTVVTDRPGSGEGISLDEIKEQLKEWMGHKKEGDIYE